MLSHDWRRTAMNILHVIWSVNPETGGPIEVITTSASVLSEHGCHQEILSLDSPLDPWTKTAALPLHAMGIRDPRYLAWRTKIPWLRYGYSPHFVPWLKENAKRYDAIIVHGLWNYVALGSWRALAKSQTPYFVYAHGSLSARKTSPETPPRRWICSTPCFRNWPAARSSCSWAAFIP